MKIRLIISLILISSIAFYCFINVPLHLASEHPRFSKILNAGTAISPWKGPWSCVADKELNVLWEVKTDNESIHDGYWTYSWFNRLHGKENYGDCYFEDNRCDTKDIIRHTNKNGLCGQKNWRLPTPKELSSLVITPQRPGQPYISTDFFPYIHKGDYWTSAHQQPLEQHFKQFKHGATAINFNSGKQVNLPYRNAAFVILVSSLTEANSKSQISSRAINTNKTN